MKFLKSGEPIPAGAVRVHLYRVENVLRPRGSMEKESLGLTILDRITDAMESWTDPAYGDSLTKAEVFALIEKNAREELETALRVGKKLFL